MCGGNPLSSDDAIPPVWAGGGAASTHVTPPLRGSGVWRPLGAHARWGLGPHPRLTSLSLGARGGGGPDTVEGTRDPSIRAP